MAKGKRKAGSIFDDLKRQRYEELGEIRERKTTRRTLPKVETAFGLTPSSTAPTVAAPSVRPTEAAPVEIGRGRRTRKNKKAGRRRRVTRQK